MQAVNVTEQDVDRALAEHTEQHDERYYFGATGFPHTLANARRIVRACLLLGTKPSDVVTADVWLTLVERVASLERIVGTS